MFSLANKSKLQKRAKLLTLLLSQFFDILKIAMLSSKMVMYAEHKQSVK